MLGPGVFSPCVITRINQIVFLKKKKTKINKNSIIILTLKNDWSIPEYEMIKKI